MPEWECIKELPNGRWHIAAGPADDDATWRPILCGEGIVYPGPGYEREPTCDDCVTAALEACPPRRLGGSPMTDQCTRHPKGWLTKDSQCYVCWCEAEVERMRAGWNADVDWANKLLGERDSARKLYLSAGEARDRAEREVERLRASLLTVVKQVESLCSRSGLCVDVDRVRAEAQRPMDRGSDHGA